MREYMSMLKFLFFYVSAHQGGILIKYYRTVGALKNERLGGDRKSPAKKCFNFGNKKRAKWEVR